MPVSGTTSEAGYFENTVAGKITEPGVLHIFLATFITYHGRPKCI